MSKWGGKAPPAALAALSGLAFWLSAEPYGLWPLALVSCGLLSWSLLRAPTAWRAAGCAALSKLFFAPMIPYLGQLSPAVLILYIMNHAAIWGLAGAVVYCLRVRRSESVAAAAFPFLWVIFDWAALAPHFLPSALTCLASPLGDSPLRGLAPYIGVYGVTLLAAQLGTLPVWLLLKKQRTPAAAAACAAISLLIGLLIFPRGEGHEGETRMRIATVGLGPAWEEDIRPWRQDSAVLPHTRLPAFFEFVREKLKPVSGAGADLILLPEDAIDLFFAGNRSKSVFERWGIENAGPLLEAYGRLTLETKSALLAGLSTQRNGELHNTVVLLEPDGRIAGRYDKTALTAGSEFWPLGTPYLPYWKLIKGRGNFVKFEDQYYPGDTPGQIFHFRGRRFGTPVCLEGHRPMRALAWMQARAGFLALLSNAGWFGGDPRTYNRQMISMSRMHAAAYGMPIFLSGKSSPFGLIDAYGEVDLRWDYTDGPGIGVSVHDLPPARRTTMSRLGEFCLPLSVLAVLVAAFKRET